MSIVLNRDGQRILSSMGFDKFKSLTSFRVNAPISAKLTDKISTVITNSPGLTRLQVQNMMRGDERGYKPVSLSELLKGGPSLRLNYISLSDVNFGTAAILKPSLKYLTTLALQNSSGLVDKSIWPCLEAASTRLEHLNSSLGVTTGLLHYLSSFPGLKTLVLATGEESKEELDRTSEVFWLKVIPCHQESLTILTLTTGYDCGWCYDIQIGAAIRGCIALERLTMPVRGWTAEEDGPLVGLISLNSYSLIYVVRQTSSIHLGLYLS